MGMTRRTLLLGAPLLLTACAPQGRGGPGIVNEAGGRGDSYAAIYGAIDDEPFPVEAVDLSQVQPQFLRQEVAYDAREAPGTIIVDPNQRFLYLVRGQGRALRYGVGVGKVEAFNFRGEAKIGRKAEWPRWTPTSDMIAREPERYGPYRGGMPGGEGNPLGARALYLYRDGVDSHYRLHGTIEPWSIGTKVSSGCIRLLNQDIIDLYRRVPLGARVVVLPATGSPDEEAPEPQAEEGGPYPQGQEGAPYYPQGGYDGPPPSEAPYHPQYY
jgi:lipoprotein-anchoring transpeptidase ErfK/SrfK